MTKGQLDGFRDFVEGRIKELLIKKNGEPSEHLLLLFKQALETIENEGSEVAFVEFFISLIEEKKSECEVVVDSFSKDESEILFAFHLADNSLTTMSGNIYTSQSRIFAKKLSDLEEAIERIGKGTFGLCSKCKFKISFERLETIPQTSLCIDCLNAS